MLQPDVVTAPYPSHREADVALRDGSTVHIRPVRPDDREALLGFLRSLSIDSLTLRFFSPAVNLAALAEQETNVDYARTYGLLATTGPDDRIVGHGMYAALDNERAEVAFTIADELQGRGLGTILLGQLAEVAAEHGIREFEAEVLPGNQNMLSVFRESGFPVEVRAGYNEIDVRFPTSLTEEALVRFERREQIAAANTLHRFFCPRSVAVVGASRQRGTVGGELFHNLLWGEFAGPVYPVNPVTEVVQSVPAYPSVEAIPGPVDLAVLVVPGSRVIPVAEQCARKGVRALVVISAGFSESGEEGRRRQAELLRVCRVSGMRMIGPNCFGIANTDPGVRLNATFGPLVPPPGRIAFSSQSGALGLAAMDYAGTLGLGFSSFASIGNKADISANDLLNYWESDPNTNLILLYVESFGNPRKFARIARRVGRRKPIIAVKSGRFTAGARATQSHTGALLAGSDLTVETLFRQAGVIRTDTLEELFDVTSLLVNQPVPKGRRVGIVTNVGGPAILCADTLEAEGMQVPLLSEATRTRLRAVLPPEASVGNPVDMIAAATADQYRATLGILADDDEVDALVAIFLPPLAVDSTDIARAICDSARQLQRRKPLLSVFMSSRGVPDELRRADVQVPSYAFPESAAHALAHAARYGEWCARPPGSAPRLEGLRRDEATALVAEALGRGAGWLPADEVARLLDCYGVSMVEQRFVATPEEAGGAAAALGGPVALKAIAPGVVHRTEHGAVRLHLRGAEEVARVAAEMTQRLTADGSPPTGFQVQRMVEGGVEMIVGISQDPHFGPIVACGAGGVTVELLKDVAIRLTPLTSDDAADMLRELKTFPLLTGFRGAPPTDVPALEQMLLRVSALADDLPQVAELDCNPALVLERGAVGVDARVRLAPTEPPRPLGARR
jgi:acetyl coenzyme A synthetase (ADP forming)-like protein